MTKADISRLFLPLGFFIFICYIIFLADSAEYNFAFKTVGHIPNGDKYAHALLYGVMAYLLNYGLGFKSYKFSIFNFQLGAMIVLTFAILEEITQYFIPSRTFDFYDLLADFVGVVLFSLLIKSKVKS